MMLATAAPVPGIGHEELLVLILQLGVLLLCARGLGVAATRVGLPSVVGELLAGLLLGPTVLGALAPRVQVGLFPPEAAQAHLLEVVAFIGVLLLLVLTGLETDLRLIAARGRTAAAVSLGGILVPFLTGVALAAVLPAAFLAQPDQRTTFALFLGTALSISAIPVIAKVLIELKVIRRDIGQLTLAAGMIDDTLGWILLSVVAGLARSGTFEPRTAVVAVASVLGFLAVSYTAGRALVSRTIRAVARAAPGDGPMLSAIVVLALAFGAVTQALGIEAVLGAFVLGILVGQVPRVTHRLVQTLETVTLAVFAPVFFASAGLKVDLGALAEPPVLAVGLVVLAVAVLGKFAGAYLGARLAGLGTWEGLSLGAGMNARGALEIIVATIGLNLGILTPELFTIIVLVAIATSLMAPPILRFTLPRVPLGEAERERLARADAARVSMLGNTHRVLLPTRGGSNSQLAAQLVARMADGASFEVTVLQVRDRAPVPAGPADTEARFERVQQRLRLPRDRVRRVVRDSNGDAATAVLAEARAGGYDLIVLGATETRGATDDTALFSAFVDRILQDADVPVMIVSSRWPTDAALPDHPVPLRRILLPTGGSETGGHAAEVAFEIANDDDALVDVVTVVAPPQETWAEVNLDDVQRARALAEEVLAVVTARGLAAGVRVHAEPLVTDRPREHAIVERARQTGADLIVLASSVQPVTRRAFLGHALDHVLRHAPCPVVVVTRG